MVDSRSIFLRLSLLFSFLLPGISTAIETDAFFCSNCVDSESARQQAMQYAAPLECNSAEVLSDPSVELTCSSKELRIVLGNYLTREIFAFRVFRSSVLPWETQAVPISLSNDERTGYSLVFEFRKDWEDVVLAGLAMSPGASVLGESIECVDGTALDWLIKPGGVAALKNMATLELSDATGAYTNEIPWYLPSLGVGLIYKKINFSFQWPIGGDEPVDEYVIDFNRANNGMLDRVVFDIGSGRGSDSGQAIVELSLNRKKSRAAGFTAEDLLSGDAVVKDECALEKLDQRDVYGGSELRVGNEPLNPDGSVGSGGSGGGASGGTPTRLCVFDFFVNGRYQYSVTAPCEAFEKEEISE